MTSSTSATVEGLLDAAAAVQFYHETCSRVGLNIHSTFVKQLLLGTSLIAFENGYLGENGIAPVALTLQRVPVRTLILTKCALTLEDVKLLCAALVSHPLLEKIDLRGVELSLGGAKEVLHLVARNTHITQVLMDDGTPRAQPIQQQCQRNLLASARCASECVVCGEPVAVEARLSCESMLLRFLLGHLKPQNETISPTGLRVLCGALELCLYHNAGVLVLCGDVCADALATDLARCAVSISKIMLWTTPCEAPSLSFLNAFLLKEHDRLRRAKAARFSGANLVTGRAVESTLLPGPLDAAAEEAWERREVLNEPGPLRPAAEPWPCTICGQLRHCSTDGATWLLRTLRRDIEDHDLPVTPTALPRLCQLLTSYAECRPCSRRCLRHVVRYALYGHGGVQCSSTGGFPSLSSVLGGVQELRRLPAVDFTVVDVTKSPVEDAGSEEIDCALTVASALADTEGVAMDPYFIYVMGRRLRNLQVENIGMDLASACEAARLVGSLPAAEAPFPRAAHPHKREESMNGSSIAHPSREQIGDWAAWTSTNDTDTVQKWLCSAFAHRRHCACMVDGPHYNIFDNIRASLWALRRQSRSVLATMKLSMRWLSLPDGIVPSSTHVHTHGFYTTVKIVGQCTIDDVPHLLLQCPLGSRVGRDGFLYVSKGTFLQCVRGMAFVFADGVCLEHRIAGQRYSLYGRELVAASLGIADDKALQMLRQALIACAMGGNAGERDHGRSVVRFLRGASSSSDAASLLALFDQEHLPPVLRCLRSSLNLDGATARSTATASHLRYLETILLSSRYPSQLLFFFHEMLGDRKWLQAVFTCILSQNHAGGDTEQEMASAKGRLSSSRAEGTATAVNGHWRTWQALEAISSVDIPSLLLPPTPSPALLEAAITPPLPTKSATHQVSKRRIQQGLAGSQTTGPSPPPPRALTAPQAFTRTKASGSKKRAKKSLDPSSEAPNTLPVIRPVEEAEREATNGPCSTSATHSSAKGSTFAAPQRNAVQPLLVQQWKAERETRRAMLRSAAKIGVVQYLRTRVLASAGAPRMSTATTIAMVTSDGNALARLKAPADSNKGPAETIPVRLLGKAWCIAPFTVSIKVENRDTPTPADLYLLFIGDSISVYSLSAARVTSPLVRMTKDPIFGSFPFASGVDAAVKDPRNAGRVFFFSGREWLLFDLGLLECIDGPYELCTHGQFRQLPTLFFDGVDGVLQIPMTSLLVFFRDYCYVVFDVEVRRCRGGVGVLNPPIALAAAREPDAAAWRIKSLQKGALTEEAAMSPALQDLLRTFHPHLDRESRARAAAAGSGSLDALNGNMQRTVAISAEEGESRTNRRAGVASPLCIASELQATVGAAPVSCFTCDIAAEGCSELSHWLVSSTGAVLRVQWEETTLEGSDGRDVACSEEQEEESQSAKRWVLRLAEQKEMDSVSVPFTNLPPVFSQHAPSAAPSLCELAERTAFALSGGDGEDVITEQNPSSRWNRFDPEQELRDAYAQDKQSRRPSSTRSSQPPLPASAFMREAILASPPNDNALEVSQELTGSASRPLRGGAARTTITSTLNATTLALRSPLALSRCAPASALQRKTAADMSTNNWSGEVLFCGAGKQSAVEDEILRFPFIEYDLGPSTSRRCFTAVLLLLDTQLIPARLLELAPLIASIESSEGGEVYTTHAVLSVTGAVAATRWAAAVAARFWRLRFHTAVPSEVGVGRLFWFEEMRDDGVDSNLMQVPICQQTQVVLQWPASDSAASTGFCGGVFPPLCIEGGTMVAPLPLLLSRHNSRPVLVDDAGLSGMGWYGHHDILPAPGQDSATCLALCGDTVTEMHVDRWATSVDPVTKTNAPSAAVHLADHPCFAALPYPFLRGWDASFYIEPRMQSGQVCLLKGDAMMLWDLMEGTASSPVSSWRHSSLLAGLAAVPVARIISAVNCLVESSHTIIGIFYEATLLSESQVVHYVEYDVVAKKVVKEPMPLAEYLKGCGAHPSDLELSGANTLLSALCTPAVPSTLFLFFRSLVLTITIASPDAKLNAELPTPPHRIELTESRCFYPIPLLLPCWGEAQNRCTITLDLAALLPFSTVVDIQGDAEGVVVTGVQLVSCGGRTGQCTVWSVQCSGDGVRWEEIALHQQQSGARVVGETRWSPRALGSGVSSRYWRLQRLLDGTTAAGTATAAVKCYCQLRLLSLPRRRCVQAPLRLSGLHNSSTAEEVYRAFFGHGSRDATVDLKRLGVSRSPSVTSLEVPDGGVYELIWDYGRSAVALCGMAVSMDVSAADTNTSVMRMRWTLCGSSTGDNADWNVLASTELRGSETRCSLSWMPNGPWRYWRLRGVLTIQSSNRNDSAGAGSFAPPPALKLAALRLYEYEGPLVDLLNPDGSVVGATSLLWAPPDSNLVFFPTSLRSAGGVLLFSRFTEALTQCRLCFSASDVGPFALSMEWSDDATTWQAVVVASVAARGNGKTQEVLLTWRSAGAHDLWRLCASAVDTGVAVHLLHLALSCTPAAEAISRASLPPLTQSPMHRILDALPSSVSRDHTPVASATAVQADRALPSVRAVELTLSYPRRVVRVRANLPLSRAAQYVVEYLGLDGVSWMEACTVNDAGSAEEGNEEPNGASELLPRFQTVMASWAASTVSPSTRWRLRLPQDPKKESDTQTDLPLPGPRDVSWFVEGEAIMERLDTAAVPGLVISSTGFTEVRSPGLLSADTSDTAKSPLSSLPILKCLSSSLHRDTASATSATGSTPLCTVMWCFLSPLRLDALTVTLRVEPVKQHSGSANGYTDLITSAADPLLDVSSAGLSLWVETSDNGDDFVPIANMRCNVRESTVVLSWEEVMEALWWRLRLCKTDSSTTPGTATSGYPGPRPEYVVEMRRACWSLRRACPSLIADLAGAQPGHFTNTIYRAWLTERFSHEEAFMRRCREGMEEERSRQSRLRAVGDISIDGLTAAAVLKLQSAYQTFIQKHAKEVARQEGKDAGVKAQNALIEENRGRLSTAGAGELTSQEHVASPVHTSADLMRLLLASVESPALGGEALTPLVDLFHGPLVLRGPFRFSRKGARWFYPYLEMMGRLAHDWQGFSADCVCASLCVYWSLSTALQRSRDMLLDDGQLIPPLSEHVASPLIVVHVEAAPHWTPSQHFPAVPALYAVGFQDQPVTVAFAINDITFAAPNAMGVPTAHDVQPLTSPFEYTVRAGVNFLQVRSLNTCPAPVFDVLRYLFPAHTLGGGGGVDPTTEGSEGEGASFSGSTVMVLTVPTLEPNTEEHLTTEVSALLCFSLPAEGLNFGIEGLSVNVLQFEVTMHAGTTESGAPWSSQVNFVSRGAKLSVRRGQQVPVSLMGSFNTQGLPAASVRGSLGAARLSGGTEIPGAVVTQLLFHAMAEVHSVDRERNTTQAPRWVCGPLACEGQLLLPGVDRSWTCACTLSSARSDRNSPLRLSNFRIALHRASLKEVAQLCMACWSDGGADESSAQAITSTESILDLCGVRLRLSAVLSVSLSYRGLGARPQRTLQGSGLLHLDNALVQGAVVASSPASRVLTVTATCFHTLQVGSVCFLGSERNPVALELQLQLPSATRDHSSGGISCTPHLLIAGSVRFFGDAAESRATLELTSDAASSTGGLATLVCHSTRHAKLEATVQDITAEAGAAWPAAQVTVDETHVRRALACAIGRIPLVAALRAHGLPLVCVLKSVVPIPYDVSRRRLSLRVTGLLFGAAFDVVTSVLSPDNVEEEGGLWDQMAAQLAVEVVEQCEESLWASYANVVGCRVPDSGEEGDERKGDRGEVVVAASPSTFFDYWIQRASRT